MKRRLAAVLAALACGGALAQGLPAERSTRHALIIGIGEYADPEVPRLAGVGHDIASAQSMARAMAIAPSRTTVLRDGAATAERIRSELAALLTRLAEGDRVFIYHSGHGTRVLDEQGPGALCSEGLVTSDGGVLSHGELAQLLLPLLRRVDKLLVFHDVAYSGGVSGAPLRTRMVRVGDQTLTPKISRVGVPEACALPANFRARGLATTLQLAKGLPQNLVFVAASGPDEASLDSSTAGGFATAAWRDCLLGDARDEDGSGAITAEEVTRCAQSKLGGTLAGLAGIRGPRMTVAGNAAFVPVWPSGPAVAGHAMPARLGAAALSLSPARMLAELHEQRDANRVLVAAAQQTRLVIGRDPLQLEIRPQRDGYLYVLLAGSDDGSLVLLFPNLLARDNRVRARQVLTLPGPDWALVAGGPPGIETLLLLLADAPRDLQRLAGETSGPFLKLALDAEGRARVQSVLANGTPAPDCGGPAAASCSDAFAASLLRIEAVR